MTLQLLKLTRLSYQAKHSNLKIYSTHHIRCLANWPARDFKFPVPDKEKLKEHIEIRKEIIKKKVGDVFNWYEAFTGIDEVRSAQKMVLEAQDRFIVAQDKRRELNRNLNQLQARLKEIHNDIQRTPRGEERYLELVTEEHKVMKEERDLLKFFREAEKTEREYFTALSNSVKVSHEKERVQADRTKYWSLIGSILGAVIGVIGSTVNNSFRMNELKQLVNDSTNQAQSLLIAAVRKEQDRDRTENTSANTSLNPVTHLLQTSAEVTSCLRKMEQNINEILKIQSDIYEKTCEFNTHDQELNLFGDKFLTTNCENIIPYSNYAVGALCLMAIVTIFAKTWG